MSRSGWTLIELIAVMALLVLILSGSLMTVRTVTRRGNVTTDLEGILYCDSLTRSQARRFHRPMVIEVQWERTPELIIKVQHHASTHTVRKKFATLRRCLTGDNRESRNSLQFEYSKDGTTPTFACEFQDAQEESVWLVIAGLSGQPIFGLQEQEVCELLDRLK